MTKIASGPQLWRANQAGRLRITDEPVEPITFEDAWELVSTLVVGTARYEVAPLDDRDAS